MTAEDPASRSPVRLRMRGVRKRFGATVALAGVDLDVRAGEVHALVGENGAGKSTLMKILAGAVAADAGALHLDGTPFAPRWPADGRRAGIAMIYQELSLAPHLTVSENILLGMEPAAGPFVRRGVARALAAKALAAVGLTDVTLDTPVARLPVAQRQLVEIARSVAVGSRVLVLDEPTSSLPARDVERLFSLIRRFRGDGHAIVYISHVLEEVKTISDRTTVLRDGRVAGGGATADLSVDDIVALMIGRSLTDLYPRSPRTAGEVLLDVADLAGARLPVSASFTLRRGEVLGIAGLMGAGRTELLRAIFGLDRVASGAVRVGVLAGRAGRAGVNTPQRRWAGGVGMVSEDRAGEGLALDLPISENLTLPRLRGLGPLGLVTPSGQDRAAARWIEHVAIRCRSPRQPIRALSGGNQQKVALARLLHADVDLLLLDEPTRGIDVGSKARIYRLIDELASGDPARGLAPRAVLMVSSAIPELLGVCDSIAVMCRGCLGPARPVRELDEHGLMREAVGAGAVS